jgi:hypothetical protein
MDVGNFVRHLSVVVLRHQMRVSNYFVNSFYSVGCSDFLFIIYILYNWITQWSLLVDSGGWKQINCVQGTVILESVLYTGWKWSVFYSESYRLNFKRRSTLAAHLILRENQVT